jgi:hypothetical protein
MIRLPQPPLSFTTHLLHCAACREQFSVAEAFIIDNYDSRDEHIRQRGEIVGKNIGFQWNNVSLSAWRESPELVAASVRQRRWLVLDHLPR